MADDYYNEKDTLETIVMRDDDGCEIEFFVIDAAEKDGIKFLLVVSAEDYDNEEPEAYIIKEVRDEGDEILFEFVTDENEYAQAAVLMSGDDDDYEIKSTEV
ncbi:MAG: DUF1292 domain-containing protein [Clostridiales bacterium]|nr:DUF1292 domain-containing protein [Clostridiales bacterium]MCD8158077.1 DUF1292 domain-containing protein [Clostridiales bacterium]